MENKEFYDGLKILFRHLKEKKIFNDTVKFLFYKRTLEDLLYQFNNKHYSETFTWEVVFLRINLLGRGYSELRNVFESLIDPYTKDWPEYYRMHKKRPKIKCYGNN